MKIFEVGMGSNPSTFYGRGLGGKTVEKGEGRRVKRQWCVKRNGEHRMKKVKQSEWLGKRLSRGRRRKHYRKRKIAWKER